MGRKFPSYAPTHRGATISAYNGIYLSVKNIYIKISIRLFNRHAPVPKQKFSMKQCYYSWIYFSDNRSNFYGIKDAVKII